MITGIDYTRLLETLAEVEPIQLKGLDLLRRVYPDLDSHIPDEEFIPALLEMMDYAHNVKMTLSKLENIPPIPSTEPVEEFPL